MVYVWLIVGFILLIKGADYFVDGSSNIAKLLRVPTLIIGLTIVAFGTSAPEATVSIIAALEGTADVAMGNVVGSNIINMTFIVGAAAFLFPLKVENEMVKKQIPFTFLSGLVLLIMMSDVFLQNMATNSLTRSDGLVLLIFLSIFLFYIIEVAMKNREEMSETKGSENMKWGKSILITVLGLAGIIVGGQLVVSNATEIAYALGMSEVLVGLTIVAIGTSLPELVTSVAAALKKQSEIALGNIVGSNIFNILFVLGASSVITPLTFDAKVFTDVYIMLIVTIILLVFSRTKFAIGKREGLFLMLVYIAYLIYIIIRN
jgi:cation:H+ antiporter